MIQIHAADAICEIRFNRPRKLNALTMTMAQQLLAAVSQASQDAAVRVLLLSAQGSAFCAGKDRVEHNNCDTAF